MNMDPNHNSGQDGNERTINSSQYEKGLELAEEGRHEEALGYMQEQLRIAPEDAEVLNDTGAILHCLGRSDEAIDHIQRARSIQKDSAEIVWNLAEAYLAVGKASEAMELFDDMHRIGILNADVINRTADVFLNQQNKADALEMLLRSLRIWPNQEMLCPMIEIIRSKRPKVAIFSDVTHNPCFDDFENFVKERFEVCRTDNPTDEELKKMMEWSDISWFECCSDLLMRASENAGSSKIIYRAGRSDRNLEQIEWANIDVLLVVEGEYDRNNLIQRIPDIEYLTSLVILPRGINVEKSDRQRGKNIAFLSDSCVGSNPVFVLQCMQKLNYIDRDYHLFLGGEFPDETTERYLRHMVEVLNLGNVVSFDGRQENTRLWFSDKHYIVSAGITENYSTELLEAMACGLKPVIHNFPGAEQIFPSEFVFNIAEEFCEKVCSDQYNPENYRNFIEENFPIEKQLAHINQILIQLENQFETPQIDNQALDDSLDKVAENAGYSKQ